MAIKRTEWTRTALAVEFGMDKRTLAKRLEGLKPIKSGVKHEKYYLKDVVEFLYKGKSKGIEAEKLRLLKYQADEKQIDVQKKLGVLAYKDEIQSHYENLVLNFRSKCLSLPAIIAVQGYGLRDKKKLEKLINDKIDEALNELSENGAEPRPRKSVSTIRKKSKTTAKAKSK